MKYKVVEKGNPSNPAAPKKQYANAVNAGKFTIRDFAKEIAGRSSLTRGDIENVLNNFIDELPTFLKLGLSVKLGEFGTLRLSIVSEGVEADKPFTADSIKGTKVIFTPGVELKDSLKDVRFEENR
ncbi:MAG: HU family DNA-binding protein [Prevotellaceae bacterium]|jgi:predicted histone-like DNA-binding protein|nr:HU family DNA-binding protein [Prevotellaceae bacterium]